MKLVILKNNLKHALDSVSYAVGSNPNISIISNVLIKTQGNKIRIASTNLEIGITILVSGKIIEDGAVSVPYDVLSSIVNNISSERINLESKENNLNIQTDNYEALIQGSPEGDFPIIPKTKGVSKPLTINKNLLSEALGKVITAAGTSDLRPEINGVFVSVENAGVKIAATDSFRLAESKIEGSKVDSQADNFQVIIPLKTADAINRILGGNKEDAAASIYVEDNQIALKVDELELVSRVIDGKFPDYEAVIPKNIETEITLNRDELINALKLASSFTARIKDVNVKTTNKKTLEIHSGDSSLGENKYMIPSKITGDDGEATFNLKYFLDGVRAESGESMVLGLSGASKPALIKSPGETSYLYILMPIKTA